MDNLSVIRFRRRAERTWNAKGEDVAERRRRRDVSCGDPTPRSGAIGRREPDCARQGEPLGDAPSPPDVPIGRYSQEVLNALASLSPEHRAVVVLRYLLELSPGEIARALELPRGTVNSRLRRGLDALESSLREVEP